MADVYELVELLEKSLKDTSCDTVTLDKSEARSILKYLEREIFMRREVDFDADYDY